MCVDVGGNCAHTYEPVETKCNDGLDNDCDGFIDGDDQDCSPAPPPSEIIVVAEDSNDDAEEVIATGKMSLTSSDLEFFWESDTKDCETENVCLLKDHLEDNDSGLVCSSLKYACDYPDMACNDAEKSCEGSALVSNANRAFSMYFAKLRDECSCYFGGVAALYKRAKEDSTCYKEKQVVGVRFNNIKLDKDQELSSARIQLTVDEANTESDNELLVEIRGEANGDSPSFRNEDKNISNRKRTSSVVYWKPDPWTSVGEKVETPDVSAIVNEILKESTWVKDNAFVFIFQYVRGNSKRVAGTVDSNNPAKLILKL